MNYVGRPGISPALALLVAQGRIEPHHRILDVGCGTGTDALLLAAWGFRRVTGVDPDAAAIATARGRATRRRLGKRVTFHHVEDETLEEEFGPGSFDVILHTLVANNLKKQKDKHFRSLAALLRPGGFLLLHERVGKRHEHHAPGRFPPLAAAKRHFRLTPGVATQLAEHHAGRKGPSYARVVLWIGGPRIRR